MVKLIEEFHNTDNSEINPEIWLTHFSKKRSEKEIEYLKQALSLLKLSEEKVKIAGISYLQYGLSMADILDNLQLDSEAIAAALLFPATVFGDLAAEDIQELLGSTIVRQINGVRNMDAARHLLHIESLQHHHHQLDQVRRMLLAMADDVRIVMIKLAERLTCLRHLKGLEESQHRKIVEEIQSIYAPLANRLGIAQIKWELEDLAFRALDRAAYKSIAKNVSMKRSEREKYIEKVVKQLELEIETVGIKNFNVYGRPKHIYSIYKKMQKKKKLYEEIYDISAVRVLTDHIDDCYKALAIVHSIWIPIPEEFDDYIQHPKANGYKSLHTAVVGPENHNIEVQIRTHQMHSESEFGIAAHWLYKEGLQQKSNYDLKISWLRQVLAWQQELTNAPPEKQEIIFGDRIYVFTPQNEIVDLPQGSTPLDFAYHIHTEIGHRCRGAKINDTIVALNYQLKTGDKIEILTAKYPQPSRDWLNPEHGYLKSTRARAKVHIWFKKQNYESYLKQGEEIISREFKTKKISESQIDLEKIAKDFNYKTRADLVAAIGSGDVKIGQILHALEKPKEELSAHFKLTTFDEEHLKTGIQVQGVSDLLTHIAHCCKAIPGDPIIGYITQGRGVTIHRQDCNNITTLESTRLIPATWGEETDQYTSDILIITEENQGSLRDITAVFNNEKINIIALNSAVNRHKKQNQILITIEIQTLEKLNLMINKLQQLPHVIYAARKK